MGRREVHAEFGGEKQRKRSFVRPSCRWEDNIEMNL
jgi:hypothetical protein